MNLLFDRTRLLKSLIIVEDHRQSEHVCHANPRNRRARDGQTARRRLKKARCLVFRAAFLIVCAACKHLLTSPSMSSASGSRRVYVESVSNQPDSTFPLLTCPRDNFETAPKKKRGTRSPENRRNSRLASWKSDILNPLSSALSLIYRINRRRASPSGGECFKVIPEELKFIGTFIRWTKNKCYFR